MNKILFSHSYYYKFDPKQWANQRPYPPLGTLYAAALLREEGHTVAIFDANLSKGPEQILPHLGRENPRYLILYDDGFNYLTKMCLTNMRKAAFRMAKMGKERGCIVIINSSDATDHYEQYLREGADFVILGEGELTLSELIQTLEKKDRELDTVKGIAFRKRTEVIRTPPRPVLRELDQLPQPAWDLIDLEPYRKIWKQSMGFFSLNIATTRGCPYKCNWCAKPIYGNRYNTRSPERVVDEIAFLLEHHAPEHFWMCDDIFGLKPGWVQAFNREIHKRDLKFRYTIQSRVDLLLKDDTIEALVQSGAHEVWVGAESGSQKILDAMDKGTKVEQIYEATRKLKAHGVRVGFFLQFGYPGETREDIQKTLDMLLDLMPDDIGISVSYPLPGTQFYETVKEELKAKANWTDSDDLALMFKNTYPPGFYRKLHRYIHKRFRLKQGWQSLGQTLRNPSELSLGRLRSILAIGYYLPSSLIDGLKLRRKTTA